MKCLVCGTVIKGRADKKTCSDKCKKAHQRLKGTNKEDTAKGDWSNEQQFLDDINSMIDPPVRVNGVLTLRTKLPANYGYGDCECKMCQSTRSRANGRLINHGPWKSASQLAANEVNRVVLPGDVDYEGCV